MSSVIAKNVQIGADTTATNNFTIYQPATPNGTLLIGNGNTGITSSLVTLTSAGNVGIGTSSPTSKLTIGTGSYSAPAAGTSGLYTSSTLGLVMLAEKYYFGQTNGNASAVLDSSGNLGLGVTPSAWYAGYTAFEFGGYGSLTSRAATNDTELSSNAYRNASATYIYKKNGTAQTFDMANGSFFWNTAPSGTAGNAITFTQAMTLTAGGRLLVGTTTDTYPINFRLSSNSGDWFAKFSNTGASSPYGLIIEYIAVAPNGISNEFIYFQDAVNLRASIRSNGGLANYQANNVNLSDRREKTNFAPAKSYLETICAIPVQTFNYIDQNMEEDGGLTLGVVAQDVQSVAPEMVVESNWGTKEDPKMRLSIYQTDLQYALMKCIQEQQALITFLQAQLTSVSEDVAALKAAS